MIVARTWYEEATDSLWLELAGHASLPTIDEETFESKQVCAAASQTMLTLFHLCGGAGVWEGDGSGYCSARGEKEHAEYFTFALTSILMLQANYPDHIELNRGEDVSWLRLPT